MKDWVLGEKGKVLLGTENLEGIFRMVFAKGSECIHRPNPQPHRGASPQDIKSRVSLSPSP